MPSHTPRRQGTLTVRHVIDVTTGRQALSDAAALAESQPTGEVVTISVHDHQTPCELDSRLLDQLGRAVARGHHLELVGTSRACNAWYGAICFWIPEPPTPGPGGPSRPTSPKATPRRELHVARLVTTTPGGAA